MTDYEYSATLFKTLGDPIRLQIIDKLSEGELCACELLADLSIAQPTLSHHMKLLIHTGLVQVERRATWAFYSLNQETVANLHVLIQALTKPVETVARGKSTDCCCDTKSQAENR